MNNSDYIKLLHKRSSGKLSAEENKALTNWLSGDSANNQMGEIWEKSATYKEDFEPDVQAGLKNVLAFIDEEEEQASPEPKIIPLQKRRFSPFALAAALAVVIGVGAVFNWYFNTPSNSMIIAQTGEGETEMLSLNDGTQVWVNENSYFSYSEGFSESQRKVKLTGEAFFDVARDEARPFIIESSKSTVTVLGTSFNVRAYENESENVVTVKSGKVRFQPKNSQKYLDLTKDETAQFDFSRKELKKIANQAQNNIAWQSKRLQFMDTPLAQVIEDIEENFGVEIDDVPAHLSQCGFNANFDLTNQTIEQVFDVLSRSLGISISKSDVGTYSIAGESCK